MSEDRVGGRGERWKSAVVASSILTSVRTAVLPALMGMGLTLAAGACVRGESRSESQYNVVLIVVDTLRADHLGAYGYPRKLSPNIDALAQRSQLFERAYSTAPWTMPSVGSILTGLYPSACRNTGTWGPLPDDLDTLAEVLNACGYRTGAVVSHFLLGRRFNFDQGFEVMLESEAKGHDYLSSPGVTGQALELLADYSRRRGRDGRPFFLFVHYFDPHYNYMRHPEYGYAAASAGRLDGTQTIEELRTMLGDMSEEERRLLVDLYDEEIAYTDAAIGRLLAALEESGESGRTVLLLTADHGEEFLEHGWIGHTKTLYEELVHVPLMIRVPGGKGGGTVEERVSLLSLMPTLLDLTGIDYSKLGLQGRSFAGLLRGGAAQAARSIFMEAEFDSPDPVDRGKTTDKKALIHGSYKLIGDNLSGRVELYDLDSGSGEQVDISATHAEVVERMMGMLRERLAYARRRLGTGASAGVAERAGEDSVLGGATARPSQLGKEEIERLHALGYVDPR